MQQKASGSKGEARAAASVESVSWEKELPRQVCSCGEAEGRQECFTTEITGVGARFDRGRVKYLMWLNQKAIHEQWQTAFKQEGGEESVNSDFS